MTVADEPERAIFSTAGLAQTLPQLLFLALFPGFFFYHLLAAAGVIPLLIGPGWSALNAAAAVSLGWVVIAQRERGPILLAVVALVAVILAYAIWYRLSGDAYQSSPVMFGASIKLIIGIAGMFALGYAFQDTKNLGKYLVTLLAIMAAVVALLQHPETNIFIAIDRWVAPEGTAGYQWFAQSVAVTAIFALALSKNWKQQAIVLGCAVPSLLALSSRSELAGFVGASVLWAILNLTRKNWRAPVYGACAAVVGTAVLFSMSVVLPDHDLKGAAERIELTRKYYESRKMRAPVDAMQESAATRHAELIAVETSPSFKERLRTWRECIEQIKASPLLGDYGGQLRKRWVFGDYAHNILEAWRAYGLVAFLLFTALTIVVSYSSTRAVFMSRYSSDPMWMLAFLVAAYTTALLLLTKSIYWPLPALAWGLVARRLTGNLRRS